MRVRSRTARLAALGVFLIAVLTLPLVAHAATWDLAGDYVARGDSSGPWVKDAGGSTVWYFKEAGTATNPTTYSASGLQWATSYSWMPVGTPGLKGWVRAAGGLPHVSVNSGPDAVSTTSPPFTWKSGAVLAHPMPATDSRPFAVIEWKSPIAGSATGSISLTDIDGGGTSGFEYWVLKNDAVVDHQSVARLGTGTTALSQTVAVGDSVYVVLGPGVDGSHSWDSTQIDFSVSVPDPPVVSTPAGSPWSLALLALGGMLAIPVARRARASA